MDQIPFEENRSPYDPEAVLKRGANSSLFGCEAGVPERAIGGSRDRNGVFT